MALTSKSLGLWRGVFLQQSRRWLVQRNFTGIAYQSKFKGWNKCEVSHIPKSVFQNSKTSCDCHSLLRYFSTTHGFQQRSSPFESLVGDDKFPGTQEIHLYGLDEQDLGIMTKDNGEKTALQNKCRIVLVKNDRKDIPVYNLMTIQRFLDKRKSKPAKEKTLSQKELHLTSKIKDHDLHIKVTQVRKQLRKGHKVLVKIENANSDNDVVCF